MTREHMLEFGGTAAATALLVMGLAWTSRGGAAGQAGALERSAPVIEAEGCILTLRATDGTVRPGEEPILEIEAINATSEARTVDVALGMATRRVPSPMSRMLIVEKPKEAWSRRCTIELDGGAARRVAVATGVEMQPMTEVRFSMTVGDTTVWTLPVSAGASLAPSADGSAGSPVPVSPPVDPQALLRWPAGSR